MERYFPNARLRVVKYDGLYRQYGSDLNIIKDYSIEGNIYNVLTNSISYIETQLKEFSTLNKDGVFITVPEYPEDAWKEGIVNAITHRDYSNTGESILVSIFDDRMEIKSPGKLPGIVTINNIINERCSRNPRIARFLFEFGMVKELNEGVPRIYSEMSKFFLEEPIYEEPNNNSVKLTLKNNILSRTKRNVDRITTEKIVKDNWNNLTLEERLALTFIYNKGETTTIDLALHLGLGKTKTREILTKLKNNNIVKWTGNSINDKKGRYKLTFE